jgi:hypothetical protein
MELEWGPHPIAEGAIVDLTFTMAEEAAVAQAVTV